MLRNIAIDFEGHYNLTARGCNKVKNDHTYVVDFVCF